jgi:hypothetical protein
MKSKKKKSRKLVGCFLLCMGQIYVGSIFSFFFLACVPFSTGTELRWGNFFFKKNNNNKTKEKQ